ncbi:hypothetical protein HELRODRAFT_72440, partial [Helobdella robusta]|uniref:HEAT repeat-containing protein 1 n=1 Tax=Helobdella robusta TaxID=6412 RepID=T1G101_HELRO
MSLKEQLQKLAVPQSRHHLESQKSSLLFDSNEVASLDSEVVLELAISGLNALVALNKSFTKYEPLLFNKSFDRMIQGKKVNKDLDNVIKQYLIELSPYFLTKPALKTLEWLVYK